MLYEVITLLASPDGGNGSLTIHQDVRVYAATLTDGAQVALDLAPGRHAWVQVAKGSVELNGNTLSEGDGRITSYNVCYTKLLRMRSTTAGEL